MLAGERNSNARKAMIAANYVGTQISWPPGFRFGVDNKTEDFLKKNPAGQVPMLEGPDGPIFESNAIAKYTNATRNKTQTKTKKDSRGYQ